MTPPDRTVWLLAAPSQTQWANPDLLLPYGTLRTVFKSREPAWESPERTFSRLVEVFADFKPGDCIAWMGGDTLITMLAGAALATLGINEWTWLRYIGRDDYQEIPIAFDRIASTPREAF